jgi:hypothetical protein
MDCIIDLDSVGEVQNALESLPMKKEDFYGLSIDRIQKEASSSNLGMRILAWILHSKRALRVEEVQQALAVEPGKLVAADLSDYIVEEQVLVDRCAGLVLINSESRVIGFAHPTVKEYLDDDEVRTKLFPNAQKDIALTCVTYLSFDAFETGFCATDKEFDARLQLNPLYDYAARYWGHHARAASSEVVQLILDFLDSAAKVSASNQAMMVSKEYRYHNYSQRVPKHITGVHLAAHFGLMEMTSALLKKGYQPDCKDTYGWTPLSWAAWSGHEAVVKLLLAEDGVDPDSGKSNYEQTPLSLAA